MFCSYFWAFFHCLSKRGHSITVPECMLGAGTVAFHKLSRPCSCSTAVSHASQVFLHIQERMLEQKQAEKDVPYSSLTFLPTKSDRSGLCAVVAFVAVPVLFLQ